MLDMGRGRKRSRRSFFLAFFLLPYFLLPFFAPSPLPTLSSFIPSFSSPSSFLPFDPFVYLFVPSDPRELSEDFRGSGRRVPDTSAGEHHFGLGGHPVHAHHLLFLLLLQAVCVVSLFFVAFSLFLSLFLCSFELSSFPRSFLSSFSPSLPRSVVSCLLPFFLPFLLRMELVITPIATI